MSNEKKKEITRHLLFWLSGRIGDDPEYILGRIALETGTTRDEVWTVYTSLIEEAFSA